MALPRVSLVRQYDTHRLVPSLHLPHGDSVLTRLSRNEADLRALFDLEIATNDRIAGENSQLPGISPLELVFDVPCHHIVNAAFCHAHPLGSRFNGPDRGAWYCAFELETSQAEVVFHRSVEFAEVNWWQAVVTYDDYLADFSASFHDLRRAPQFTDCLAADSYVASQKLAEHLLDAGSAGVVYPSVRRKRGTCISCFRPALVGNVRRDKTWEFTWEGPGQPKVRELKSKGH